MAKTLNDQLKTYLSDAYSIEQQALAQLRTAPDIAGDMVLATHFREHLVETERQAEMVRERLEAHGGSPSKIKDAVMALGGKGFLLFARSQPDTPGKLLAHAHSYEAMEWAAYELLIRLAEKAGDAKTAATAREIRDQEKAMVERLGSSFDDAVEASLEKIPTDDLGSALKSYLADAHALEAQAINMLGKASDIGGAPELDRIYAEHLEESRGHARLVEERLDALGGDTSAIKDAALSAAALNWGMFFQAQSDTPAKLAAFSFAFEHLEMAGYELLQRTARRAGDLQTAELAERILADEKAMADRLFAQWDTALEASLEAMGVTA